MMKKIGTIILILFSIFCVNFNTNFTLVFAQNKTKYFGRATEKNICIYSTPYVLTDNSNVMFEIPKSYFVEITGLENELFYKAKYLDIYGYIRKAEFSYVNVTPIKPFAENLTFRVFTPSGANLRSSPNESYGTNNLVTTIPFLETNLSYYGICSGEEAISYKGNIWYYCKYIKSNQEYLGYVYSPLCDMLTLIPTNNETFDYIEPNFSIETEETSSKKDLLSLNTPTQIAIIVGASLPCILIIYFLFKPTKILTQPNSSKKITTKSNKKNKIKRLKSSDYYELDDDLF